jgi:hypothetical protein
MSMDFRYIPTHPYTPPRRGLFVSPLERGLRGVLISIVNQLLIFLI